MVNKNKIKGSEWERDAVKILNAKVKGGTFKRVPGSGAIGTISNEPLLTADISGKVEGVAKGLKGEAKIGYGGSKQFTLKKEWLDKIGFQANATYSIPFLVGRFLGARSGVQNFIVLDIEVFCELLNTISGLKEEVDELFEETLDKN